MRPRGAPEDHDTPAAHTGHLCGLCGEGFPRPEGLDEHLAEAHVRRKG